MLPKEIEAKYELRGTLGSGAMGTVYDAMDRIIERRAAIKVVRRPPPDDPEAEEAHARFRREAQAAGRLSHPSIVGVYDYGENAESAWIVMELVEGGSLKARLDRGERFPIPEIVRVMDQMLAALAYSHGRGVVHRDIKPANIMLTADGAVKLADFGIARLENSSMTQVGTVMGTPSYMAPEQLRGETVDARADIWAAGVVLYQLLTGEKPFDGGFSAVMHKALNTEPPPPSQLSVTAPRAFDAVVARALAKRPDDRFPTATAFAEAIRAAAAAPAAEPDSFAGAGPLPGLDGDATVLAVGATAAPLAASAPPPPQSPSAPVARRKAPVALIAGGGVVLAAAAAAWLLLVPGGGTQPGDAQQQEEIRREAERLAQAEADRLRQQAEEEQQRAAAAEQEAQRRQQAEAEAARRREAEAQAAAEAKRQSRAEAQAEMERRRLAEAQAAAEAERQRQADTEVEAEPQGQAQATAEAEGQRQAEAQAQAEAESRRQAEQRRTTYAAAAAAAATAEPCSLIGWTASDAGVTLTGVIRRGGDALVRQALAAGGVPAEAVRLQLQPFDGPYCDALAVLRPVAAQGEAAPRADVIGAEPLARGELLRLSVTMPAYAGQLYVSYLMNSGEVANLVPSRPEPAGAEVRLGDPQGSFTGWEVDEPFGTDMVLVFASERPIFPQRRPVVEKVTDYLAALSDQLRAMQSQGSRVSARALVVETVPGR